MQQEDVKAAGEKRLLNNMNFPGISWRKISENAETGERRGKTRMEKSAPPAKKIWLSGENVIDIEELVSYNKIRKPG